MEKTARETTSLETGVRLTGFNVYDYTEGKPINTPKSYGKSIKVAELPSGIARFFSLAGSDEPRGQGLPKDLLQQVLQGILVEVKGIREAVQETEMRMVGGSILIIYEADWDTLKKGLQLWKQETITDDEDAGLNPEDSVGGGSEDDESSDEVKLGPPYLVKLIDFAHTSLREGAGPDTGAILGINTTIALLTGRLAEVSRQDS
ncbi:SAICAR synthase-like protein [Ramaria rubella]|nr:SAICAR synthase-like protein [Ramaria rubella]